MVNWNCIPQIATVLFREQNRTWHKTTTHHIFPAMFRCESGGGNVWQERALLDSSSTGRDLSPAVDRSLTRPNDKFIISYASEYDLQSTLQRFFAEYILSHIITLWDQLWMVPQLSCTRSDLHLMQGALYHGFCFCLQPSALIRIGFFRLMHRSWNLVKVAAYVIMFYSFSWNLQVLFWSSYKRPNVIYVQMVCTHLPSALICFLQCWCI